MGDTPHPQSPAEKDAGCVTGTEAGCYSYRCGSDCTNEFDRMHPCPACAAEEWRDGRLVRPAMAADLCVHFVGLTPGMWCGACNTHPQRPGLPRDETPATLGPPYHHEDERECFYRADGSGWWPWRFEDGVLNRSGASICVRTHPDPARVRPHAVGGTDE